MRTTDKFTPKCVPCLFIGYPATQKGYKLYNLLTQNSFVSRDVRFLKHIMLYKLFSSVPSASPVSNSPILINSSSDLLSPSNSPSSLPCTDAPAALSDPSSSEVPLRRSSHPKTTPFWHSDYAMVSQLPPPPPTKLHPTVSTPVSFSYSCFLTNALHTKDPTHYKHAVT